jgi:hypothetical protein
MIDQNTINWLKENLQIRVKERNSDYYSSREKTITVELVIDGDVVSEDSFNIINGERDRSPY